MAKTPLVYTHKGNRTTIAISASFDSINGFSAGRRSACLGFWP